MSNTDLPSPTSSAIAPGAGLLVPVDFSAASVRASGMAVSLAEKWGARVTFVHVLAPLADEEEIPPGWAGFMVERRAHAETRLDAWRQTHAADREASCEVLEGRHFEEIVRFAGDRRMEMIVMARTRGAGFIEQLLGSTTERVVRHAKCPVLVIGDSDEALLRGSGRILLTTDFSPASLSAFPWAGKLARAFAASITLANVQRPMGLPGTIEYDRFGEEIDALRARADQEVAVLRDKHLGGDLAVAVKVVEGTPHRAICRLARRLEAAVIVMGSHGRTGWRRALIGSTAEHVVRHASCSVLVIRSIEPPATNDPD